MSIVESKMEMLTHLGAGTWADNTRENLTNQPMAFVEIVKQSKDMWGTVLDWNNPR